MLPPYKFLLISLLIIHNILYMLAVFVCSSLKISKNQESEFFITLRDVLLSKNLISISLNTLSSTFLHFSCNPLHTLSNAFLVLYTFVSLIFETPIWSLVNALLLTVGFSQLFMLKLLVISSPKFSDSL